MSNLFSHGNSLVLPDARLREPKDVKIGDFVLPSGKTVRMQWERVYCQCGKPLAWVPSENTADTFFLCAPCFEKYGQDTLTHAAPLDAWCEAVVYEMESRYGRTLTDDEIVSEEQNGTLGNALITLARESPFPVVNPASEMATI